MIDRGTQKALNKFSDRYKYKVVINEGVGDISLCKNGGRLSLKYDAKSKTSTVKGKPVTSKKLYNELIKVTSEDVYSVINRSTMWLVILGGLLSLIGVVSYSTNVILTLILFTLALISFTVGFITNN